MRRSVARRPSATFSLFPFLAVLLCTMGALLLVLVVLARQVGPRVEGDGNALVAAKDENQQLELELLEYRIKQLEEQRSKTEEDLRQRRLELGHVEEHGRQLADRLSQLDATIARLAGDAPDDGQRRAMQDRLAQLRSDAIRLQQQLAAARRAAASARESYAIVPFEGPNQTHRRPIYIECRADGIILQPEGIRLTEADFQGPGGPGNPLAAALRAAREHLAHAGSPNEKPGEPYPLLLVRPSGIVAYYVALQSLKSWQTEFGYELVEEDWTLAYQPPDVELAQVEQRAVDNARQELRQLAVAVPRTYGVDTRPSFAPPRDAEEGFYGGGAGGGRYGALRREPEGGAMYGGADYDGGPSPGRYGPGPGHSASSYPDEQVLPASPGGGAMGGYGTATEADLDAIYGAAAADGETQSGASPGGQPAGSFASQGTALPNNPSDSAGSSTSDNVFGEQFPPRRSPDHGDSRGTGDRTGDVADGTADDRNTSRSGTHQSGSYDRHDGLHNDLRSDGRYSSDGRPSEYGGVAARRTGSASDDATSQANAEADGATNASQAGTAAGSSNASSTAAAEGQLSAGGSADQMMQDPANAMPSPTLHVGAKQSVASKRGKNWGLPAKAPQAVGITRPIRLRCTADRLTIMSENYVAREEHSIPLGSRTEPAVDELVARIWKRMDGWGMAGRNLYWRPVLQLEVAPDGNARAEDLKILLADSGLDITEKRTTPPSVSAIPGPAAR